MYVPKILGETLAGDLMAKVGILSLAAVQVVIATVDVRRQG